MSENQFNPKEGRDCFSCVYIEHKQGTSHKACMRTFQVGDFLSGILSNKTTGTKIQTATYIDYKASVILPKEGGKQVACVLTLNQWSRMFPLDYDPTWVLACLGWSKDRDERFVTKHSAIEKMMGVLGSVGRI
jgi:hypothetical protein